MTTQISLTGNKDFAFAKLHSMDFDTPSIERALATYENQNGKDARTGVYKVSVIVEIILRALPEPPENIDRSATVKRVRDKEDTKNDDEPRVKKPKLHLEHIAAQNNDNDHGFHEKAPCRVCWSCKSADDDALVNCNACGVSVHQKCYFMPECSVALQELHKQRQEYENESKKLRESLHCCLQHNLMKQRMKTKDNKIKQIMQEKETFRVLQQRLAVAWQTSKKECTTLQHEKREYENERKMLHESMQAKEIKIKETMKKIAALKQQAEEEKKRLTNAWETSKKECVALKVQCSALQDFADDQDLSCLNETKLTAIEQKLEHKLKYVKEAKEKLLDQRNLCIICQDEERDHTIVPCGHVCICGNCKQHYEHQGAQCPICRSPVQQIIKLYNA